MLVELRREGARQAGIQHVFYRQLELGARLGFLSPVQHHQLFFGHVLTHVPLLFVCEVLG
jgi:hypothetical protein